MASQAHRQWILMASPSCQACKFCNHVLSLPAQNWEELRPTSSMLLRRFVRSALSLWGLAELTQRRSRSSKSRTTLRHSSTTIRAAKRGSSSSRLLPSFSSCSGAASSCYTTKIINSLSSGLFHSGDLLRGHTQGISPQQCALPKEADSQAASCPLCLHSLGSLLLLHDIDMVNHPIKVLVRGLSQCTGSAKLIHRLSMSSKSRTSFRHSCMTMPAAKRGLYQSCLLPSLSRGASSCCTVKTFTHCRDHAAVQTLQLLHAHLPCHFKGVKTCSCQATYVAWRTSNCLFTSQLCIESAPDEVYGNQGYSFDKSATCNPPGGFQKF